MPDPAVLPHTTEAISARRSMLIGVAALLVGACIIAFAAILVKASPVGPQATAFWRLTLALPALALWLSLHRRQAGGAPGSPDMRYIVLAGLFFAGDLAFWHAGILITTAANATLLANLTPIIVVLFGWLVFRETVTRRFIIVCAIVMTGAALLSAGNLAIDASRLGGDLLSLITAFWYGAYILMARKARERASTPRVMFLSTLIAAPIALVIALAFGEALFPANLEGWMPLILLGVVVHVLGQGAIMFGLGRVPAPLAALIILFQPVVTAIAGWLIFEEALSALQIAGAGIILSGLYAAQARPAIRTGPR